MSTGYVVVGGLAVAGIAAAALLASEKQDVSSTNPVSDAFQNAVQSTTQYWEDTTVPLENALTEDQAKSEAAISEQQEAIYTPQTQIPVWQGYGTVNDSLKGWQQDWVSVFGTPGQVWEFSGDVQQNLANAQANQLTAQQNEGMINWLKWYDWEENTKQATGNYDLEQMEQLAAWLQVNDKNDYDSFMSAWKTLGKGTDLQLTSDEQQTINNYAKQLQQQSKTVQYGSFAATDQPYTVDSQGNKVMQYSGVIMVGDQGPTGSQPKTGADVMSTCNPQ